MRKARKFKKHYRRKFKRYYKKKYRNRKMKTIYGRKTVPISRRHLKKRKELQYRDYRLDGTNAIAATTWTTIWATTGTDANLAAYLPPPIDWATIQGPTVGNVITQLQTLLGNDGGIIGRNYAYKMCDLRFFVEPKPVITATATAVTRSHDYYRVLIIKKRQVNIDFAPGQQVFNQPIDPKDFKILYDKCFCITTGLNNLGASPQTTDASPGKSFRFKFPFRYLAEYQQVLLHQAWKPTLDTFVYVYSLYGQINVNSVYCRQYFTQLR